VVFEIVPTRPAAWMAAAWSTVSPATLGTVPSGLHASFQNHAGTSCQPAPGRWAQQRVARQMRERPCSHVSLVCGLCADGSQHARAECAGVCSGCSARCLPRIPTRLGLCLRALGIRHIVRLAVLSWSLLWRSQPCPGLVLRLDERPRAGNGYEPAPRRGGMARGAATRYGAVVSYL
jgi:hypothetical protein